jgi:nucleoside 2-deoxyribosyltransferase
MNRIYLAGPPYADEYRRRAATLIDELGLVAVDPMRRDYRGDTRGHETEIVEGDLAEIESCDAVLACFTSPDEGTAMEAWYAHGLGKRVVAHRRHPTASLDRLRHRRRLRPARGCGPDSARRRRLIRGRRLLPPELWNIECPEGLSRMSF